MPLVRLLAVAALATTGASAAVAQAQPLLQPGADMRGTGPENYGNHFVTRSLVFGDRLFFEDRANDLSKARPGKLTPHPLVRAP